MIDFKLSNSDVASYVEKYKLPAASLLKNLYEIEVKNKEGQEYNENGVIEKLFDYFCYDIDTMKSAGFESVDDVVQEAHRIIANLDEDEPHKCEAYFRENRDVAFTLAFLYIHKEEGSSDMHDMPVLIKENARAFFEISPYFDIGQI